ncbi:DUF6130 family protein [Bradyrhizobium ontarionense]|uniref:DUF6130 family protein n=1 Tax=Bradyrhizobium ontarionense TaxID=2898149 RepID=UPI003CE48526
MTSRGAFLCFALALSIFDPIGWSGALAQEHMTQAVSAAPQPAAHLVVNQPLAGPLSAGLVIITFRTENLKIVPVYGETASQVVPRLGHLHITVDDGPWHWLHASEEPIILQGLPSGPHRVLIELADASHKVLDAETRTFEIPQRPASH